MTSLPGILEECAQRDPPSKARFAEYVEIWGKCTLLEKQFWDMAINLSYTYGKKTTALNEMYT